ncbi:MAG: enoyl-[acyl-carrier-protein] reductase FabK [Eubacteriales bacterium]|nr:enoyl-[acyl-carrier-protein] reductase FabK [Eubacteriales bacterium]
MKSNICDILGIKYPIFQGAMAWVSDASLAAAVSNAGGLGIIAGGNAPAEIIREEIRKVKTLTDKPFAVNIMLLSPFADEVVQTVCEEGVKVVTTGAGNPAKYMDLFNEHNISVIPVIPSVAIAQKMEKIGAKAVIAEGMEAGGHIGKLTTMALVPQVVDAVNIPVIAAGGIADGRGCAAAFMLGAKGVQVGTRFLVADECTIHENYKQKVIEAKDIDSVITGQITGHPVRVLRNKLARLYDKVEKEEQKKDKPDIQRIEDLGKGALQKATREGDVENGSIMAGQIAGMVSKKQSCQEIINELVKEFDELMNNK